MNINDIRFELMEIADATEKRGDCIAACRIRTVIKALTPMWAKMDGELVQLNELIK